MTRKVERRLGERRRGRRRSGEHGRSGRRQAHRRAAGFVLTIASLTVGALLARVDLYTRGKG